MEVPEASSEEDDKLWAAAKDGQPGALEMLLRSKQNLIFRFCLSQLKSNNRAIEATQEVALRLIENLGKFRGKSRLDTWILGFANNICREQRRKQTKLAQADSDALQAIPNPSRSSQQVLEQIETQSQLKVLITRLPDRQREAITLRFFEQLSLSEIAEVMDVSLGTVKATLKQTLTKLKIELEDIE